MSVHVENPRALTFRRHPFLTELTAPLPKALLIPREYFQLGAQRLDLRNPIQSQKLAPLSGSFVAQGLQRTNPGQGQKRQHQENRFERIIPGRQREVLARVPQQSKTDRKSVV